MPVRNVTLNKNDLVVVTETRYPIGFISQKSGQCDVYRYDLYGSLDKIKTFNSIHDARYFALQYFSTHQ